MQPQNSIVIGKLGGAFGVKGWLKVNSFTRPPSNIASYKPWFLCGASKSFPVTVLEMKPQGKGFIVCIDGIENRESAQELTGMDICVDRAQLPDPEAGEFYWADLEGLEVRNNDGLVLGRVDQMISAGAADVMIVVGEQRILIPFVLNDTVTRVDGDAGVIEVNWQLDD